MSVMRARVYALVERIPAWPPLSDTAGWCRSCSAIAIRVALTISPVERSSASSRSSGGVATLWASSISSSVVSPMAETTTTIGRPDVAVRATRTAAARIRSAVASDEPPYFWTVSPACSANDVCSRIAQRQAHRDAHEAEVLRG